MKNLLFVLVLVSACGQETTFSPSGPGATGYPPNGSGYHPGEPGAIPPCVFDPDMPGRCITINGKVFIPTAPDAAVDASEIPDAALEPDAMASVDAGDTSTPDASTVADASVPTSDAALTPDASSSQPDALVPLPDASTVADAFVPSPDACVSVGCNRTHGYWMTHSSWPVNTLTLGTVSYNQSQLTAIMSLPTTGNGLLSLAQQQIAAKLNTLCGGSADILALIAQADQMIGNLVCPPVGNGWLDPAATSNLTTQLDNFNMSNECQ